MCCWHSRDRRQVELACVVLFGTCLPGVTARAADDPPAAPPPDTRSREQLFLDVFKRPPPDTPISAYVMVSIDGAQPAKLRAALAQDERQLKLEGEAVLRMLRPRLRTEIVDGLAAQVDAAGWLGRDAIEAVGLHTAFDPRRFEVAITTDPRLRNKDMLYLGGRPPNVRSDALRPAPVSAFVNLNATAAERSETTLGVHSRATQLAFAADGALAAGPAVLEGQAYGDSLAARSFHRGDVRLIHDRPEQALRFSAGDLRYPVVGYQTIVDMGGVSAARDFSLQPFLRDYQSGQFEFHLEQPAEVRIYVNNSLASTVQLPAGTHDIRGLTPAVGLNDTRLVIQDAAGRIQTLDFSFIYTPLLLEKDRDAFSYNAGFRRNLVDGEYRYDSASPVVSAAYLRGVTAETTLGGYLQADTKRTVLGLQSLHAFRTSALQLDAAVRRTDSAPWGVAAKADWVRLPDPQGTSAIQWQLTLEYLGADFGNLNETLPSNRSRLNFYSGAAMPAGPGSTLLLTASYQPASGAGTVDSYGLAAGWNYRWGKFTTLSLSLRHRRSSQGVQQNGLFFGLTYSFSDARNNFFAAKELESDVASASWSSQRPGNESGPYGFASARAGADDVRQYRVGGGFHGQQGLVEAWQDGNRVGTPNGPSDHDQTVAHLQTAVVYAGGAAGLVSQVRENFVIVRGKEGMADTAIKVDPDSTGGARGRSRWFTPAVVADLASYQVRDLRVEPVDPPIGSAPEKLSFAAAAAYKSGFLLELGKEQKIVAVGRLVDAMGQGIAHVTLEVRRVGDEVAKPLVIFTGRTGRFQLPDVRPGRYELRPVAITTWERVIVEVREAPEGVHRLGDVSIVP